jgi:hypothetical protein
MSTLGVNPKGNKHTIEAETTNTGSIYDFEAKDIDGNNVPLSKYKY